MASAAIDSTHRLWAALIDRDLGAAGRLFEPSACVWWSQRSGALASVEGAEAVARALLTLLEAAPPTRLAVMGSFAGSTVTTAYVEDTIAWTLEMKTTAASIDGAFLRGRELPAQ